MPEEREGRDRKREDEDEVWAQLVASFDEEPAAGQAVWPAAEGLDEEDPAPDPAKPTEPKSGKEDEDAPDPGDEDTHSGGINVRGIVIPNTPVLNPGPPDPGPRDFTVEEEDEGHFVPPPPPPLPQVDTTTKFA